MIERLPWQYLFTAVLTIINQETKTMRPYTLFVTIIISLSIFVRAGHAFQQQSIVSGNSENLSADSHGGDRLKRTENGEGIPLFRLIGEALLSNPGIHSVEQQWESAQLRIPQAGAWAEPNLSLNIANFPVSSADFTIDPMTQKQISLKQTIPFPGISSLKEQIASEASEISGHMVSDARNTVVKNVSRAFYEIFLIDKSISITFKNKQILNDFITIASKKYEVGEGLQQDVLKAQVEMSKLLDKLIKLRKNREAVTARLNSLLNRPPGTELGPVEEQVHEPVVRDAVSLQQTAAAYRPLLLTGKKEIQRREFAAALAEKQYWPDITFCVTYGQRQTRQDLFSAQVTLKLPLWQRRKQDKNVEETLADIRAAENAYEDSKNSTDAQIVSLVAALEETDERLRLLHEVIIPQATQSLSSAVSGYQVNKVDFLTLLNNQITLFTFELDYFRLLTEYKKRAADLDYIIGRQFTKEISSN